MSETNENTVYCIVLAAGSARRYGSTKQLARVAGETLVGGAMRKAERVCGDKSVLVAGNNWQQVVSAAAPLAGYFVVNPSYDEGLGTSIRCGVAAVADVAAAVLLVLADQPLVTPGHLESMIARWHADPESIVTTVYRGTCGVPSLFPARDFAALQSLAGDVGAKKLLDAEKDRLLMIPFADASVDIDTPDDLDRLRMTRDD